MAKILIQELTTPGCPHCAQAKKFLEEEIKQKFPDVEIQYIEVMSQEGQELVQKHMIFSSPAIFINGELVSTGGINKDDIKRRIEVLLK